MEVGGHGHDAMIDPSSLCLESDRGRGIGPGFLKRWHLPPFVGDGGLARLCDNIACFFIGVKNKEAARTRNYAVNITAPARREGEHQSATMI